MIRIVSFVGVTGAGAFYFLGSGIAYLRPLLSSRSIVCFILPRVDFGGGLVALLDVYVLD